MLKNLNLYLSNKSHATGGGLKTEAGATMGLRLRHDHWKHGFVPLLLFVT